MPTNENRVAVAKRLKDLRHRTTFSYHSAALDAALSAYERLPRVEAERDDLKRRLGEADQCIAGQDKIIADQAVELGRLRPDIERLRAALEECMGFCEEGLALDHYGRVLAETAPEESHQS